MELKELRDLKIIILAWISPKGQSFFYHSILNMFPISFFYIKRNSFYIYFLFFISFQFVSCDNGADISQKIKVGSINFADWEDLIEFVDVIPLQDDSNCMISMADHCLLSRDRLFFSDYKTKQIYSYSTSGKYIGKIGQRGHAKNEYTKVLDLWLTDNDSTLVVLDTNSLLYFNSNTGKLNKRVRNRNLDYERFAIQNDSSILFIPDIDGTASIILERGEKILELRQRKRVPFIVNTFYKYGDSCRVISDYGDFYIDTYDSNKLHKTYSFELGNMALPEKLSTKTYDEFEIVDSEPDYFKCITRVHETSKNIFVKFVGPNQTYYSLFANKHSLKSVTGPTPKGTGFTIIGADTKYFYALLYPDYVENGVFTKKIIDNYAIETKNPILIKFSIKNEVLE